MTVAAVWRGVFIERLKATGNVTLAARGAGVNRQNAYRARSRSKKFRRQWDEALDQAVDLLDGEARRRATGMKKDVWYAGRVVGTENVYDSALLMLHKGPSSTAAPSPRPPTLVTAGTWLVRLARHARDGRAGHGGALASFCLARLLALEESSRTWASPHSRRAATADRPHRH